MISRPEDASWISHETFATQNKQVAEDLFLFYTNFIPILHLISILLTCTFLYFSGHFTGTLHLHLISLCIYF